MTTKQKTMFEDVADFHRKFGLEYSGPPRGLDLDLEKFRTDFMAEELFEYAGLNDGLLVDDIKDYLTANQYEGFRKNVPLADKLDALVDLAYVVLGTAHLHGFDFDEAWRRVHAANMAKVRAERDSDSARGSAKFDVVKPPGWTAPDLSDLVGETPPSPGAGARAVLIAHGDVGPTGDT